MKPLRILKKDKRLKIIGPLSLFFTKGYHVYSGYIDSPDFYRSVVFGYDEGGLMEHVSVNPEPRKDETLRALLRMPAAHTRGIHFV